MKPRSQSPWSLLRALTAGCFLLAFVGPAGAGDTLPLFERELDTIPFFDGMGPVPNAWYGGWEQPRPQLVDIDADGDLDLFVAEDDGQLRLYRNAGTPVAPSFELETDDYAGIHDLYFTRFHDLDADGDFDLLVEAPPFTIEIDGNQVERTGAYVYTNVGTAAEPAYQNLSSHPEGYLVDDLGDPIAFVTTSPDFVDLEGDGDPDLLMGDVSGFIILYRNVGTPTNPVFQFETDQYQDILIIFGACGSSAAEPELSHEALRSNPAHGFMLFSFFDLDGDTRPDAFVGDQFNSNVYHYRNIGPDGSASPNFQCQTQQFFNDELGFPGFFSQFLVATFGDIDGDLDPDALLGSGASSTEGIFFYRNDPPLKLLTRNYLAEFDRGRESAPAFADLDGDLDLDLFLGSTTEQEISLYENIGTPGNPQFALIQEDWLPLPNSAWCAPEFADIDADLDLDLFVGMTTGAVRFFRNDSPGAWPPSLVEVTTDPDFGDVFDRTFTQAINSQAVPRFFDEDGDEDLDVLVGNWNFSGEANLLFFRNDGTKFAHSYVLASSDYQGLGTFGQNLAPVLQDLDDDTDLDLLVGNLEGELIYARNDGGAGAPSFVRIQETFGQIDVGRSSIPVLADLDADLDPDLVLGERGGGLNFYRNQGLFTTGAPQPLPGSGLQLSAPVPNPFDERTLLRYDLPSPSYVTLGIYDVRGRLVRTLESARRGTGTHSVGWDGLDRSRRAVAPGVYFARLRTEAGVTTRKLIRARN